MAPPVTDSTPPVTNRTTYKYSNKKTNEGNRVPPPSCFKKSEEYDQFQRFKKSVDKAFLGEKQRLLEQLRKVELPKLVKSNLPEDRKQSKINQLLDSINYVKQSMGIPEYITT